MPEVIGRCPVCEGELRVTRLRCSACDSELSGSFAMSKLGRLKSDQQRFVEIFIKNEGKIKDTEEDLGISYPTVRARLKEIIRALGYEVDDDNGAPPMTSERRREILDALARREISADEAQRLLRSS